MTEHAAAVAGPAVPAPGAAGAGAPAAARARPAAPGTAARRRAARFPRRPGRAGPADAGQAGRGHASASTGRWLGRCCCSPARCSAAALLNAAAATCSAGRRRAWCSAPGSGWSSRLLRLRVGGGGPAQPRRPAVPGRVGHHAAAQREHVRAGPDGQRRLPAGRLGGADGPARPAAARRDRSPCSRSTASRCSSSCPASGGPPSGPRPPWAAWARCWSARSARSARSRPAAPRTGRSPAVGEAAQRAWRRGVEVAGWTAVMEASAGLAVQASFLAVLAVGGARVASGDLPVSSLIAFLLYLLLLSEPLTALVQRGRPSCRPGCGGASGCGELHDLPAEPGTRRASRPAGRRPGRRRSRSTEVWFRYPVRSRRPLGAPGPDLRAAARRGDRDRRAVRRRQEHDLRAAGAVLRARSAGRSRSTAGRRSWPLPELRAAIGYVEQDAPILAGTLADNLRLAAPDASDERLDAVVRLTRLDGVLDRLPDGSGHGGRLTAASTLSGGERQRIAIARALLAPAPDPAAGRGDLAARRGQRGWPCAT